jgi:acylphosphatase
MGETSSGRRRWTVIYHGRVQGVGFRQTVKRIARRHPVLGYVRNLPDGTVEMVVEGPAEELELFNVAIHEVFTRNIEKDEIQVSDATGELKNFEIRH